MIIDTQPQFKAGIRANGSARFRAYAYMPAVTYSGADGVMLTSSVTLGREWGVGHGVGGGGGDGG